MNQTILDFYEIGAIWFLSRPLFLFVTMEPDLLSPESLTRSFPLCFSVPPTCPQSMSNYLVLGASIGSLAHGVPWLTGFSSLTTSSYASRVRHHCKLALLLFDGISSCARSAATRLPSASNRINIATYMCPSRWEVGERLFFLSVELYIDHLDLIIEPLC